MQTILGSTGIIGRELAKELTKYSPHLRLVSRSPKKVNQTDELFTADLRKQNEVIKAVKDSEIVYLTAGLKYNTKVWSAEWPLIMKNVIEACKESGSKLVFFDNVYSYGRVDGWMTEDTPMNPVSKKGIVRKQIAEMILNEVNTGALKAQIVRAADFYGYGTLAFVTMMVFDNYAKGDKAQWLLSDKFLHSFTYAPDAARATALLGNTELAYNQLWHLPTDKNVLTGREFIELTASAFGVKPKFMNVPKWMLRVIGLFTPEIRESIEMLYQNDSDYLFSSDKFEKAFGIKPTTYRQGISETVKAMSS
ncbi:MAG: NAD-dependent epimerase/dehydratase family protein [Ignavibacteria bacterium]|nr:NAD-dependent epimerase/dehydratase family protein [Ignavibacteria bacterium]